MSSSSRPEATVRQALWLVGLLVVLGGLLGMHGLDHHGGPAGASIGAMSHATMSEVAHEARRGGEAATTMAAGAPAAVVSGLAGGGTGMGMGAAGMCMAVLMLGLLAMLLRLGACRGTSLLWLVARGVRGPDVRGRDPDPPSLFSLSIQRC